jgi:hypothetical protein
MAIQVTSDPRKAEVFISYASQNRERVVQIAGHLESAGVTIWRDQDEILGGENYGPKIVHGIKNCQVLLLVCTDASMRSKNVKQEIQLAWHYGRPYLPLLGEPIDKYPEQVQYWLEGWQWIEVLDRPAAKWLPHVLQALAGTGVKSNPTALPSPGADVAGGWLSWFGRLLGRNRQEVPNAVPAQPIARPTPLAQGLEGLRALARFTDQIWPVPADRVHRGITRSGLRDLGAPQDDVQHGHRLGSRVCLAIESDRTGHLLLLDEGPSGKIYCLCPSSFAPDTRLAVGRTYLPQRGARYDAFEVSGQPGREHLLAILTDEPLGLDWMPNDQNVPARVLSPADINTLLARLRELEGDRWTALSTYFDVIAGP